MTRLDRAERIAARRAEKRAWVRKHARALFVCFAAFLVGGFLLGNLFAVVAGIAGLAWTALARRGA